MGYKTRGSGKKKEKSHETGAVLRSFAAKRGSIDQGKKDDGLNTAHHGLLHGWSTHAAAAESLEPLWEGRGQGWLHGLHQRRANYLSSSSEDTGGGNGVGVVSCDYDCDEEKVGVASASRPVVDDSLDESFHDGGNSSILRVQGHPLVEREGVIGGGRGGRGEGKGGEVIGRQEEEQQQEEQQQEEQQQQKEEQQQEEQQQKEQKQQQKKRKKSRKWKKSVPWGKKRPNHYLGMTNVFQRPKKKKLAVHHHVAEEHVVSEVLHDTNDDVAVSQEEEKDAGNVQAEGQVTTGGEHPGSPQDSPQKEVTKEATLSVSTPREDGVTLFSVDDLNCAIIKKDVVLFQRLARCQHLLHSRETSAMAPLMCACRHGDDIMVKTLLEFGALVNICDHEGKSPLIYATARGNLGMVTILLDHGASVDQVCNAGLTALHYAVDNDSDEISEILIDAGSDLDFKSPDNRTALMKASTSGKTRVVLALIASGCSIDIVDEYGQTALMSCLSHGIRSKTLISALIDAGPVEYLNTFDYTGRTALFHAITNGIPAATEKLLKSGCEFNYYCTFSAKYPLILAIEYMQHSCVSWMLRHGANPDCSDRTRKTALMYAAERGYGQMVADLIHAGASIHTIDKRTKFSALDYAAYHGHKHSARILLQEEGKTLID